MPADTPQEAVNSLRTISLYSGNYGKAAKYHTNPSNGKYANMRLGIGARAKSLLDGGVKNVPTRS